MKTTTPPLPPLRPVSRIQAAILDPIDQSIGQSIESIQRRKFPSKSHHQSDGSAKSGAGWVSSPRPGPLVGSDRSRLTAGLTKQEVGRRVQIPALTDAAAPCLSVRNER